ncbi:MAG: hypothetical protein KIS92_12785 [Planctomycetota bacterium]|nr:hypothetical protein [Planctomycetota bacterium]
MSKAVAEIAVCLIAGAAWAEEVLVVEQSYNVVKSKVEESKDIRQKLYMSSNWIRIDEYAGEGKAPSETFLIDLKKETIVNLDNENLTKTTETFEQRRKRMEERKAKAREDLANVPEGAQKEKLEKLYKALLDDERSFEIVKDKNDSKEIAGAKAESIRVVDARNKDYVPLKAYMHPEIELPYNSAEVLFILQIIGGRMKEYLNKNRRDFRRLPMEMELDLAAGGTLKTMVLSVEKVNRETLDKGIAAVPDDYKEKSKGRPQKPVEAKTVAPD